MAIYPGDTFTNEFTLVDGSETPITGIVFTPGMVDLAVGPDGATFSTLVLISELGAGAYRVSVPLPTTAIAGNYYLLLRFPGTPDKLVAFSWDVVDRPGVARASSTYPVLRQRILLVDHLGDPITGATADLEIAITDSPVGTAILDDITIIELGMGVYEVALQTNGSYVVGSYYLVVRYTGSPNQAISVEWTIDEPSRYVITRQELVHGPTLQEVRRGVLQLFGDVTVLTATAATSSSIFEDVDNIVQGSGNYAGRELYVTGGTPANLWQRRRVSGSSSQGRIELTRALPAAVAAGDEAELINTFGTGIRFQDVMQQISDTIEVARPTVGITADITGTFDPATRAIEIPDDFYAIDRVESRSTSSTWASWEQVQRADAQGDYGYWVDGVNRVLYMGGNMAHDLSGRSLRIYGLALVTPPENDADVVPVNREWMVYRTAADLALRPMHLSGQASTSDLQSMGMLWEDRANKMRSRIRSRPRAGRMILS